MEKCMITVAAVSIAMSCVILCLLLFNKLAAGRYSSKWRYYIWMIVLLGLLVPFRPAVKLPFKPLQVSTDNTEQPEMYYDSEASNTAVNYDYAVTASANGTAEMTLKPKMLPLSAVMFAVWIAGIILTLAYHLRCHRRFNATLKRWGTDITDIRILSVLEQAQTELGIQQKIRLQKHMFITSPMLAGFIRPVILLPETTIQKDELLLILKHELVHYKRKDLWVNLLVVLTSAVHWFNPVVYIMAEAIRNDCEASCDEAVLSNAGTERRRIYGEAVIKFIGTKKTVKTELSTNFYGGKNTMKKRLISIMDTGKKKAGIAVLCAFLVLSTTFLSGFVFSVGGASADTPDKVLETVLAKTNGGTVVECELDYLGSSDKKIRVYDIEVINGNKKYEVKIGIDDLKIYGFEESSSSKDRSDYLPNAEDITAEKAVEIALEKAGVGEVKKWELSGKGTDKLYKVEILSDTVKYTMELKASDGKISKYEEKELKSDKISKTSQSSIISQIISMPTINPTLIGADEAQKLALDKVGGGKVEECELDLEKGVWVYEIEIKDGKTEYEVDINAETGDILKFEIDD